MPLIRVAAAAPLEGFRLRLQLTDGSVVERDIRQLLNGPIFDELRRQPAAFRAVHVEAGTVAWPNGADLDPDVLIWGGPPPESPGRPPETIDFASRVSR
jgi:hypothetical protein